MVPARGPGPDHGVRRFPRPRQYRDYTWRYWLWEHLTEHAGVAVDFVGPRNDLFDPVVDRPGDHRYAADFDTDHAGVWGATAAEVAERIGREVVDADPHYLLLLVGVNDIVRGASTAEVLDRTRGIVAAARLAKGDIRIVLGEIPPVWGTENDRAANTVIHSYNTALPTWLSSSPPRTPRSSSPARPPTTRPRTTTGTPSTPTRAAN